MNLPSSFYQFIAEHLSEDVNRLRLKQFKSTDFEVNFAIDQIEARQKVRTKLPTWAANAELLFPAKICAEQASSEATATYKSELFSGENFCDLTGGLGIDSFYFSRRFTRSWYVERYASYCKVAAHNFTRLNASIEVVHTDAFSFLQNNALFFDLLYLDPARRDGENNRVYSITGCEPNLIDLFPLLKSHTRKLLIKVSPMADITHTLSLLGECNRVHIVSLKNECKELLFEWDFTKPTPTFPRLVCVDLQAAYAGGEASVLEFDDPGERSASVSYVEEVPLDYLYEPNASVLKAGGFKATAARFSVKKLAVNSHLYVAEKPIPDFPGRGFKIIETIPYSSKTAKQVGKEYSTANITTRNFPLSAPDLRKQLRLKEGGDLYLFGTTLANGKKVLILGIKAT